MTEFIIGFILVIVIALLMGWFMPRQAMRRRDVEIAAPRTTVWEAAANIETHPRWHPDIKDVEKIGDGRWKITRKDGQEYVMETAESLPPERIRWMFEETHGGFRGEWRLTLEERGGGTRIKGIHHDEMGNPLMRVVAMLRGGRHSGLTEFLEELRVHLERKDVAPPADEAAEA